MSNSLVAIEETLSSIIRNLTTLVENNRLKYRVCFNDGIIHYSVGDYGIEMTRMSNKIELNISCTKITINIMMNKILNEFCDLLNEKIGIREVLECHEKIISENIDLIRSGNDE